jgi:putative oxidoreductase
LIVRKASPVSSEDAMATTAYHHPDVHRTGYNVRAAAGVSDSLVALGRVLIALIFVASGAEKIMDLGATTAAIEAKNLPMPEALVAYLPAGWSMPYALALASAALELGGGVLIILGWQTRLFAVLLAAFTAITAYFFHDFWHYPQGAEYTNNMIHFMKNVSIIGGFLMLAAVGAGRYSIDGTHVRDRYLP